MTPRQAQTTAEVLAQADDLAARFESEDFDGEQVSPEEYERLRSRIRDDNVRP